MRFVSGVRRQSAGETEEQKETHALVLDDADPRCLPPIARTQPHVVGIREPDFDWKMGA